MVIHPSDVRMVGHYVASIEALREAGGRITTIEERPDPIGIAHDSVRLCWVCDSEIVLADDDYREVVLRYSPEGLGTTWARFCGRRCWEAWAGLQYGPRP